MLPKVLKSCPKYKKFPNLVTLIVSKICGQSCGKKVLQYWCPWCRGGHVEDVGFGTAIVEQSVGHVSQVDADNGERVSEKIVNKLGTRLRGEN